MNHLTGNIAEDILSEIKKTIEQLRDRVDNLEHRLQQVKIIKEEPKFYAKIKGWELHVDNGRIYWRGNIITKKTLVGFNDTSNLQDYTPILTKSEWNELGINNANADFEEAGE